MYIFNIVQSGQIYSPGAEQRYARLVLYYIRLYNIDTYIFILYSINIYFYIILHTYIIL